MFCICDEPRAKLAFLSQHTLSHPSSLTFLDDIPQQDSWKLRQIMRFSTYPIIYNLMSYNQEYNEQPLYELDLQHSEDSESDTTILQNLYRCNL